METGRWPTRGTRRSPRCDPRAADGRRGPAGTGRGVGERRRVGERVAPPARRGVDRHARRRDGARRAAPPRVGRRRSPPRSVPGWQRRVPVVAKTAVKDAARVAAGARVPRRPASGPWRGHDIACVWQRHELFHTAGPALGARARRAVGGVRARAARVAGAAVGRAAPGLGRVDRTGRRARAAARAPMSWRADRKPSPNRSGASASTADRIVITPTGADLELFRVASRSRRARAAASGSTTGSSSAGSGASAGSTRSSSAVDALAGLEGATLLLVGDGPERAEHRAPGAGARRRGASAPAPSPHDDDSRAPRGDGRRARARDRATRPFHYSPLKLAEYLAAGLAVVAPRAGGAADAAPRRCRRGARDRRRPRRARRRAAAAPRRSRAAGAARAGPRGSAAAERWSWDRSVELALAAARPVPRAAPEPVSKGLSTR